MDRQKLAELREKRAELHHKMDDMLADAKRDGGNMSKRQEQAYDRLESRFDELDEQIKEAEREEARELEAATWESTDGQRSEVSDRREDVFLGERRFADAFGVPAAERREEVSLGALLQGLAGTRQLDPDSAEGRALTGAGAGGSLVPAATASALLDGVFAASVVHQAGAQAVPMTARTLTLPRIDSPPVPGWHAEGQADVPEDEPGIGAAQLSAKTIAVRFSPAVELLEDASVQATDGLAQVMVQAIAAAIDAASLVSDGSGNSPVGLLHDGDVSHTTLAAELSNYSDLLRAIFAVRGRNIAPTAAVYSERTAEELASLVDTTGQPLRAPRVVEELPQLSTTAVPNDEGAGTNESAAFVGKFDQLAVGYRPNIGVRVEQSRVRGDDLTVEFVAYARADVAVLRPAAFQVLDGILPVAAA